MIKKFFITVVFFVLSFSQAFSNATSIIKDQNGCKIYNPAPKENETVKWNGQCKNGFAFGEGKIEWFIEGNLVEEYIGEMNEGWADGNGTLNSKEGVTYSGGWKKSKQHGKGTFKKNDGSSYQGDWKNGLPHGWGTFTDSNGKILTGEWEKGEFKSGTNTQEI